MEIKSKGGRSLTSRGVEMTPKSVDEDEIKVLCLKWFNNSIFGVCLTVLIATTSGQSIQVVHALDLLRPFLIRISDNIRILSA